jgi:hypothetical protein
LPELEAHFESKHKKKGGPTIEECFDAFKVVADEDEADNDDKLPEGKIAWKCAFTGNYMFHDGYRQREIYEGMVLEVKGKDGVSVGGNIVIDLVAQHGLK